jgi:hypothetical protein
MRKRVYVADVPWLEFQIFQLEKKIKGMCNVNSSRKTIRKMIS